MVDETAPLTRGPRAVHDQLIGFLQARLPIALAVARQAWGLDPVDLPDPVRYLAYESVAIDDRVPIVSVAVGRSLGYARTDAEGDYQVRYICTVYGWLKADDYDPPQQMRDDFASVLASVFLATPSLGAPGRFRFEETTLEVNYSDAAKVKGDRWLAGVSLTFQVQHSEQLRPVRLGVAEDVWVAATLLDRDGDPVL